MAKVMELKEMAELIRLVYAKKQELLMNIFQESDFKLEKDVPEEDE